MFNRYKNFSFLTLRNRYIPALLLIAVFSTLAFINVNDIMRSIKDDGKLINISGRQRMLSQKLVIIGEDYISHPSKNSKLKLIETIQLMESSHNYLLQNKLSEKLQNLYFDQNLDNEIKKYINDFYLIGKTKDDQLLTILRKRSQHLLVQLNIAVEIYEEEDRLKLKELKNREQYIYILTILALIFEAVFIFYPASKKIKENTESLEEAIKEKTKDLQKSIDIISKNVIYSRTDLKGNITYVSDAFSEVSGYSKQELLGQPHSIIRHQDMPKKAFKEMWDTIQSGKVWIGEVKNKKKNGGFYWVEAHISPEYDKNGNNIGYAAVRHNITDRKEIEELNTNLNIKIEKEIEKNREKEQKLFEQAKRLQLSRMIENIAHQWRQPLSAISTTASGIQMEKEFGLLDDDKFIDGMENIVNTTQELSKTIEEFTKYISMDDQISEFILQECIDSTLNIINSNLQNNQITLIKNYDNIPIKINSIKNDISQVILNIIYNSMDILIDKKTPESKIIIEVHSVSSNALITIEDNAGGIPEGIISKIFDPYFTTKHQSQGTGMGLHICQTIVTKHLHGTIDAENSRNGAKFYIELPLNLT